MTSGWKSQRERAVERMWRGADAEIIHSLVVGGVGYELKADAPTGVDAEYVWIPAIIEVIGDNPA